jgi:hypothetical protein
MQNNVGREMQEGKCGKANAGRQMKEEKSG